MRKILVLLLSFALLISFTSCGSTEINTTFKSDSVKEVLTEEDIERVKTFAAQYILDVEGYEVEITGYKILHDIDTDLPNAVDVTYKSDDLYESGGETYEVNGWIIVELYGGSFDYGYNVSTFSLCNPSYYANVDAEHKLYYSAPFGFYYKREGSDTFFHTKSSAHNIVPGEYKDPTLSY